MKLVILGLVCCLSTYIGVCLSKNVKEKEIFYNQMLEYIVFLIQKISFFKEPINKISREFIKNKKKSKFIKVLSDYLALMPIEIEYKDKDFIKEFFNTIGNLDYDNQLNYLNSAYKSVENKYKIAKADTNTKGKLFYKLGLIVGITLMIFMV